MLCNDERKLIEADAIRNGTDGALTMAATAYTLRGLHKRMRHLEREARLGEKQNK